MALAPAGRVICSPYRCFERCALQHVEDFRAMMDVARDRLARLVLDDGDDDFHVRSRQVGALQLLSALRGEALLRIASPANATAATAATTHVLAIIMRSSFMVLSQWRECALRP